MIYRKKEIKATVDIFLRKVNIWNVNCARATAFIFDKWMGVLVKVSKFLRHKMENGGGGGGGDSKPTMILSIEPIQRTNFPSQLKFDGNLILLSSKSWSLWNFAHSTTAVFS